MEAIPPQKSSGKATLPRLRDSILYLTLAGTTLCALPSIVGARYWMLDNLTSFTLQLFFVLVALTVAALVCRKPKIALFAVCIAALQAWVIYPHLEKPLVPTTPVASWLVANVLTANRDRDALVALIRERNPHLIGLVETNAEWLSALDEPLRGYSYRVLHPREDNFGMALYSREPLIDPQVRDFGVVPTITASIKMGDREVDLVLVHALPPVSPNYTRERNAHLARLGTLRPLPGHGIVMAGDFNVTPYSPTFREFFGESHLKRVGGLAGTFPTGLPSVFRIPIDHVLVAGPISVSHTLERDINSDHLPLWVEIGEDR